MDGLHKLNTNVSKLIINLDTIFIACGEHLLYLIYFIMVENQHKSLKPKYLPKYQSNEDTLKKLQIILT